MASTLSDEEEAESFSQSIQIEESLLGVTPSPIAPEVYEIYDISYPHMDDLEEYIRIFIFEEKYPSILYKKSPLILLF